MKSDRGDYFDVNRNENFLHMSNDDLLDQNINKSNSAVKGEYKKRGNSIMDVETSSHFPSIL
jgi:hypothetical protein